MKRSCFSSCQSASLLSLGRKPSWRHVKSVWIDPKNGQSYYVVTYYDPKRVSETQDLAQLPLRIDAEGRPVLLGSYGAVGHPELPGVIRPVSYATTTAWARSRRFSLARMRPT